MLPMHGLVHVQHPSTRRLFLYSPVDREKRRKKKRVERFFFAVFLCVVY